VVADALEPMIGPETDKIFKSYPHMTWDNYFSGDAIMNHLGRKGFGATMTCRRDRLPGGVPKQRFHFEKGKVTSRSRVARFLEPITVTKSFPADADNKEYTRAHVSFQSAGSTNFSTVNALNSCRLFVSERKRGNGRDERKWVIEMNDARYLYLKTYGTIDTIDSLIKKCHLGYRCRKYWHSAMLHGIALVVVVAYDMYLEAARGSLRPEWKIEHPMDFHQFRDRLSGQMLKYNPAMKLYPGDSKFRVSTQMNKKKQNRLNAMHKKIRLSSKSISSGGTSCLDVEEYREALRSEHFCTDSTNLQSTCVPMCRIHQSLVAIVSGVIKRRTLYAKNVVFGCTISHKGERIVTKPCSLYYHDPDCFGFGYVDYKELKSKKNVIWNNPSKAAKQANKNHIRDNIIPNL